MRVGRRSITQKLLANPRWSHKVNEGLEEVTTVKGDGTLHCSVTGQQSLSTHLKEKMKDVTQIIQHCL